MLNDGFQYLEQRDANDNVTHAGVVSKKSPFSTSDNTGIYDVIAENLRALKDSLDEVAGSNDLSSIRDDVQKMYDDMRTNEKFGSTEATAQAKIATEQAAVATAKAKEAAEAMTSVKASQADITSNLAVINTALSETKDYLATIATAQTDIADNAQIAQNHSKIAKEESAKAALSESNAEAWAISTESPDGAEDKDSATGKTQSARSWTMTAIQSASSAAASQSAAADSAEKASASEAASAKSATASENSAGQSAQSASASAESASAAETSAAASASFETNAGTSATSAKGSATEAKASAKEAAAQATAAANSSGAAATASNNARLSETNAGLSANAALLSQEEAAASAEKASTSESNASASASGASISATSAKTSEIASAASAQAAASSAVNAAKSESNAELWAEGDVPSTTTTGSDGKETTVEHKSAKKWAEVSTSSAKAALLSETGAQQAEASAIDYSAKAGDYADHAKTSETSAKTSETSAAASANGAASSAQAAETAKDQATVQVTKAKAWAMADGSPDDEFDSDSAGGKTQSSKTWAGVSKSGANTATAKATEAKSYAESVKESMQTAQTIEGNIKSLQESITALNAQAQQYLTDAKAIRDSLSNAVEYKGSKDNFSDLPTTGQRVGDMWNVVNADTKNEVKAGDNVIWNGSGWDNMGGIVDTSAFAKLNSDVTFKTITAATFTGALKGNADTATTAASADSVAWANVSGRPTALPANGGTADLANSAKVCTGNAATASKAAMDSSGRNIVDTYPTKTGAGANGTWEINITGNAAFATAAASANSVAWANVSGRPSSLPANGGTAAACSGNSVTATTASQVKANPAANASATLVYSQMADNDYFRILTGGASNKGYVELATADDGNEPIYVRQYTGVFSSCARTATLLDGSGNTSFPGRVVAGDFYTGGWLRTTGSQGWYSESHGGGWYMSDDTWIRSYNGKNIYTSGVIQCDGGFNGTLKGTAWNVPTSDVGGNIWIA